MRYLAILFVHLLVTVARLFGPGGARSVVAESLLVKHQLLILNRSRTRAPNLRPIDRVILGLCTILMRPSPHRLLAVGCGLDIFALDHHIGVTLIYRDRVGRCLVERRRSVLGQSPERWLQRPDPGGRSRQCRNEILRHWEKSSGLPPQG